MRVLLVAVFLLAAGPARADHPDDAHLIDIARQWTTAMHAHDLDAAVAHIAPRLVQTLCVDRRNGHVAAGAAAVRRSLRCELRQRDSVFHNPIWTVDADVSFQVVADTRRSTIPRWAKDKLRKLAADHGLVTITITETFGEAREVFRLLVAIDAQLRITMVVDEPVIIAN